MKNTNTLINIENIIYNDSSMRELRYVSIVGDTADTIFYFDCLLGDIFLLQRKHVLSWKLGTIVNYFFPNGNQQSIANSEREKITNDHLFYKNAQLKAAASAEKIRKFLLVHIHQNRLSEEEFLEFEVIIYHLTDFFSLKEVSRTLQQSNTSIYYSTHIHPKKIEKNIDKQLCISELKFTSKKFFKEFIFDNKQNNAIYLSLIKIFDNFDLLTKYQINDLYLEITNIDQYLYNHMKNIFFSQQFPMIDIEKETLSILDKINHYLTSKIDNCLDNCINEQLKIMQDIEIKFQQHNA